MSLVARRAVLAGLLSGVASGAFARTRRKAKRTRPASAVIGGPLLPPAELVAAADLGGKVSFAVADAGTGRLFGALDPDMPMPPASTAKTITSLYALEHLGTAHRFETRLVAAGAVKGGRIDGDLVLVGGGDPTLTTDDLGDMVEALVSAGVRQVTGRLAVWGGALPYLDSIDPEQPCWMGYSPAVCGLNLNFNRVNFVWQEVAGGYRLSFDARAERYAPAVSIARMAVEDRAAPLFSFAPAGPGESWTVAGAALGRAGSRWLPVRRPDLYAGDVLRTLARDRGIDLSAPVALDRAPQGTTLVSHQSQPLPNVLREMMKYSNNMVAETVGMAASLTRGIDDHGASAAEMTRWLAAKLGGAGAVFVDHSGLGGASRVTAAEMVVALTRLGPAEGLAALMKPVHLPDDRYEPPVAMPETVVAKTGTLNFVSALVGYLTTADGQHRVFAIYTADTARRDAVPDAQKERPPGLRPWLARSRRLQEQLLRGWA